MRLAPTLKLTKHIEFSKYINGQTIFPINLEISPSGFCNASCPWCFYLKSQSKENIDTQVLLKFIDLCQIFGTKAITWTGGGEPTMHPDFKKITQSLKKVDQGLFTNALKVPEYDPSVFNWIRVSKTNLDFNIESLKKLRECRTVGLCINDTGTLESSNLIVKALDLVHKLNLDYLQVRPALNKSGEKTSIVAPVYKDDKLIITDYKYSEANKERIYTKCEGFHFVPFLWEDGRLDVCGYRRCEDAYNIGNIYNDDFNKIVKLFPDYVNVTNECQICCKNHEINTLIHQVKTLEDENFV